MAVSLLAPGFLFLVAATALLIIVSVGTPIWNPIAFIKIGLASGNVEQAIQNILPDSIGDKIVGTRLVAGMWGWCLGDQCTKSSFGYNIPPQIFGSGATHTINTSTKVLILHPIAAALAVFALVFALCGNIVSGILASLASFIAFLVCLVAFAVDIAIWTIARNRINDGNNVASTSFGPAFWMTLAATVLLLLSSFFVCCAHHRSRRNKHMDNGYGDNQPVMAEQGGRRRFWQRRRGNAVV